MKLTLLDLPVETQKDIFKHSTPQDLIALALVSRHFHSIASSQLWRSFGIVFPDDDDPAFDSPIDGLAGGLDTLVTSKHNYARYLKEISLDTLSGGERGERAYKQYGYETSCGKFMNTLFALVLKDAVALETFYWNIRVELNRPVFAALHALLNLRNLHVRLQIGQSMYQAPPPLPSSATISNTPTADNPSSLPSLPSAPSTPPPPYSTKAPETASKSSGTTTTESRTEPPTFSGFRSLNSLAVLDIDCLSYIPELAACVHKSSLTLKKLKLSLSEALAIKARKPGYDEMEDSDDDMVDELGNPINPPPTAPGGTEGTLEKEAKVRAERSEQEAVLGKIFGVGKPVNGKKADTKADSKEKPKSEEKGKIESSTTEDDAGKAFINDLKALRKLMETTPSDASDTAKIAVQQETLDLILKAAEKFVSAAAKEVVAASSSKSNNAPGLGPVEEGSKDKSDGLVSETVKADAESAGSTSRKGKEKVTNAASEDDRIGKVDTADGPGLFDTPSSKDKPVPTANTENSAPEDIDVEHPDFEEFEDVDDQEEVGDDVAMAQDAATELEKANAVGMKVAGKENMHHTPNGFVKKPETKMSGGLSQMNVDNEVGLRLGTPDQKAHETTEKINLSAEVSQPSETQPEIIDLKQHDSSDDQSVKDYIRSTRKIPLRSFSLYLIPIRPSVLDRALDLSALHRIVLLNVGPQAAFWTLMSNTHKKTPLQLKKIYTDNVTTEFLGFVSEIDGLTELFMLERTSKTKVESLAPKTTVAIEDIRKSALQKHARTLKKLMIKNENDYSWDINGKSVRLLTKRGRNLAELAICVDLKNFHLLLQYISGLVSLKALYILTCRTDDTCQWVVRELRNFAIDNIAHYPELKLEYLALDSTVERVIRKKVNPKRTKNLSSVEGLLEGKEMEAKDSETSSDDENSDEDQQPGLKIETLGVKFYDVYGVRIFRKDVKAGIL
ncbi:hypothetical protein GP486_000131 [Trichoglossum hirsutum]|uniref:F-box domain-containing protein n=1 Tax=Trichoglossum hirsutum TaxID=265104 RepID=A0A9P8RTY0_9PEZI|nr:hypothetical protein GP486_000131 [Trichoglossum hirsutum]